MASKYLPQDFEIKWLEKWAEDKIYSSIVSFDKPKKYILDMFPYPSGDGLHVGHTKVYTASDILARYYRAKGYNVLHPMGWDAFGLPAENYAIKTGVHPKITTAQNISNIKAQMQRAGFSYDWDREINTTDEDYYRWTQWIFLKLFEQGLAYEAEAPINWCPSCKTGLANEEVVAGHCDRCGAQVERKEIRQWILRITKYADRLLDDLSKLDWPQPIIDMQTNWIGKSQGSLVKFDVENKDFDIEVYTTRIDTIFGVTALVIAPEHVRVHELTTPDHRESIGDYLKAASGKSDLERTELAKEKSGVFTGSFAINPVNSQKIPIWVADYVLGFYGTGAVMLVPAHDQRDLEFAKKYNLPIAHVIKVKDQEFSEKAVEEYGHLTNSDQFNGLTSEEAKVKITQHLKSQSKADFQTQYKLRDWVFSRQRYWGEPIPVVHCAIDGVVPLPEDQLPLKLPEVENYQPTGTGDSPLAALENWVNTTCPKCGGPAQRETNTMPQWAGSCWYYLRFIDPQNPEKLVSSEAEKYWMNVDWYLGGAEHAVLHLLYARFWHKLLFDIGVVSTNEPFQKLSSVGLVLAADGQKMSKSKGNVVRPDAIINEYGADTLRVYEAFMGPFENAIAWDPTSINGVHKFLSRVYQVIIKPSAPTPDPKIESAVNKMIQKISTDIENLKLNTPVAAMMEFLNLIYHAQITQSQKQRFLICLSPFAPFLAEELWMQIGESGSIHQQVWPKVDPTSIQSDQVQVVVQINGKPRDLLQVSPSITEEELVSLANSSSKLQKYLLGHQIVKTIYVPAKVLSLVLK